MAFPVNLFFTGEFKRNLRQLAKKYRRIKMDIQPILDQLLQGHTPGDPISGTAFQIYKVRAANSDSQRGKSGGYRMIYWQETPNRVILVTIYSKAEQSDIAPNAIRTIIARYEAGQPNDEPDSAVS
jgi:mRNA-degrading endonuclease RelE of RelBE toxin-antitoxin system